MRRRGPKKNEGRIDSEDTSTFGWAYDLHTLESGLESADDRIAHPGDTLLPKGSRRTYPGSERGVSSVAGIDLDTYSAVKRRRTVGTFWGALLSELLLLSLWRYGGDTVKTGRSAVLVSAVGEWMI